MLRAEPNGNRREHKLVNASANSAAVKTRRSGCQFWLPILMMAACLTATAHAQQYYVVDCTGANPSDYPSITSALAVAGPGSIILVNGPCNENVTITNAFNAYVGAFWGQTATINGNVSVWGSDTVFLYGLNVTNPAGDAFDVTSSHTVTLYSCTGNGNQQYGLNASTQSDVTITGPASFDNNGAGGIDMSDNSSVSINSWNGPLDISNNRGSGVWGTAGSVFWTPGSTTIENNANPAASPASAVFGISLFGNSKAQIGACSGPNVIQGNQAGGINLQENSEISLWNCGQTYQSYLLANGPVGISAGLGSQVTLYDDVQITGHSGSGVELWGKSQLYVFGQNLISQNGTASDPRSAGIVVDGNSEAYLRGGQISGNEGPGILALVNSSVDFTGATLTGNSGGIITCDSSAYMVSDLLAPGKPAAGIACRTPHNLGNRRGPSGGRPPMRDFTALNKRIAWYKSMATAK
jgi:hypothetical protein